MTKRPPGGRAPPTVPAPQVFRTFVRTLEKVTAARSGAKPRPKPAKKNNPPKDPRP